jgi:hypothetical protein
MRSWRGAAVPLAAAGALLYLAAMVVSGAMPVQRQLARFEAKGVMTLSPERIRHVELSRGTQRLALDRTGEKQWATADRADLGAVGARISMAVQMMHTSGPVREIDAAELEGVDAAPFGLDPPLLSAALYEGGEGPVLTVHFGARNPDDFLQYMRVEGDPRLYLMSRFVGEEWSGAMNEALAR